VVAGVGRLLARNVAARGVAGEAVGEVAAESTTRALTGGNPLDPQALATDLLTGGAARGPGGELGSRTTPPQAAGPDPDLARVGRWMGRDEYDKMLTTKMVQEGAGGTSYVAYPADLTAFEAQAKPRSLYVEYDVPHSSLYPAGKEEWKQIAGPDSMYARYAARKGEPVPQFPPVSNIEWVASKI
jgi:hypothetical protein